MTGRTGNKSPASNHNQFNVFGGRGWPEISRVWMFWSSKLHTCNNLHHKALAEEQIEQGAIFSSLHAFQLQLRLNKHCSLTPSIHKSLFRASWIPGKAPCLENLQVPPLPPVCASYNQNSGRQLWKGNYHIVLLVLMHMVYSCMYKGIENFFNKIRLLSGHKVSNVKEQTVTFYSDILQLHFFTFCL